ncbi:RNA polymerase sigma factor [Pedococcus sp. KACC 23699]|uniref:RNA polymerase sigma factor n=1 Tax=Pedococcus sp. KACC 23699 TaxID=3149228 RepID=A0AAU7JSK5_9MICO
MSRHPDSHLDGHVDRHDELSALFRQHAARVHAYARRHVEPSQCDDVVSETFLVAWRRPDQVPDEPLPWLLVVARNVVANQRRTARRADEVWFAAVRQGWTSSAPSADEAVHERDSVLRALEQCTRAEREALLLTAWDGLSPTDGAAVAGCSVRAFTVRLHRARTRLRAAYAAEASPSSPLPAGEPARTPRLASATIAQEIS